MSLKLGQGKDCSGRLEKNYRFSSTSVLKSDILLNSATRPSQNSAYFGCK